VPEARIENPILNSAFAEPTAHWRFGDDGITDERVPSRRVSSYFIPIPQPKNRRQLTLETSWTSDRITENEFINQIRREVTKWRSGGYVGVTAVTRSLLAYWIAPERERRLFFCQIEAVETTIFLTEVATKTDPWIASKLRDDNEYANNGLPRLAIKMATGAGKTVVMAMLIAWQALNKLSNPKDARFSDAFILVAPGVTIRDRLRVLVPSAHDNYYVDRDIVAPEALTLLQRAQILIIKYHSFLSREKFDAPNFTKEVLAGADRGGGLFKETPGEMVRRVCRTLGTKRNVIVINDEAHHCYRERQEPEEGVSSPDDVAEAKQNAEAARVWISGLEAVRDKIGVRAVYDLSATPFFLSGSGYKEGTLFPWVISDFSLIDAIESGIVKIPRVPVSDDQMAGDSPTYRDLWRRIRDDLPKKGRGEAAVSATPVLPIELDGALRSLYSHYKKSYDLWAQDEYGTPPVYIVICNNTAVSKLVFDWIAGYDTALGSAASGNLELFSNAQDGQWLHRPKTLLIDSAQLESGEAMSDIFKQLAAREISEFKTEYLERFPGRTAASITDEELLREVMNTVGKSGKLGEHIRCVVSVSMLTEGWDANTVTHILGVRAFGTQLLCEQVVGRGLRRISYEANSDGHFEPEYAEVYGVPFSFIPTAGSTTKPVVQKEIHRVHAMPDRASLAITFPHVVGYRYKLPEDTLVARFGTDLHMVLSPEQLPLNTTLDPIAGESVIHSLDELKSRRVQNVAFTLAKYLLETKFADYEGHERPWLFPQLAVIAKNWLDSCVTCKSGAFIQMLLIAQLGRYASEQIYQGIVLGTTGDKEIMPILRSFNPAGTSSDVAFNTTKPVYLTDPEKCHINYLVADTESWEQKMADVFETGLRRDVVSYIKNQGLGFNIPYTLAGAAKHYVPDFIVRYDDGHGQDPLNLIVEVTGERRPDKAIKVSTAQNLWVPAINNDGRFGRWAFIEILDPWDAESLIRSSFPVAVGA
jgi:type III restriction enzyme